MTGYLAPVLSRFSCVIGEKCHADTKKLSRDTKRFAGSYCGEREDVANALRLGMRGYCKVYPARSFRVIFLQKINCFL